MDKVELLLAQSEVVKECAKHLSKKIKEEKKILEIEEANKRNFMYFDDCGDYYYNLVRERKIRIDAMVEQKISLEKFSKKLKHMAKEV